MKRKNYGTASEFLKMEKALLRQEFANVYIQVCLSSDG
jgi:hypothetical protein